MIEEDCIYGELVKACFYCGSSNIQVIDMGTLIKHKCNVCGKTNILTKRLEKDKFIRKMDNKNYPMVHQELFHRKKIRLTIKRKLKKGEIVHHINLDRKDFSLKNLFLCKQSTHIGAHISLNQIIKKLISEGVIKFNTEKGVYEYGL